MKIKIHYQLTILFAVLISLSGCKVQGCLDVSALNYNKSAVHDCSGVKGGSDKKCCKYPRALKGCTDNEASNYNANATKDDGSCEYVEKIIKPYTTVSNVASLTKYMSKNEVRNKLGIYPFEIFHNKDKCEIHVYHYRRMQRKINAKNQFSKSALKNGQQVYEDKEFELTVFFKNGLLENIINENSKNSANDLLCFNDNLKCTAVVDDYLLCYGCMDDGTNDNYLGRPDYAKGRALNYNVDATEDDGSCEYASKPIVKGCKDSEAKNYNANADIDDRTLCDYCPCLFVLNPDYDSVKQCNEQCIPDPNIKAEPKGCTDKLAVNYNAKATKDDGSCSYCPCDSEDYYYVLNKSKDCVGDPCIKVKRVNENEIVKDDCSLCDLLDIDNTINFEIKAKAGANIKTKQ